MQIPLPPFPASCDDADACAQLLGARNLSLRAATLQDVPFMRQLYGTLRADELERIPWPDHVRQQFLDGQFSLQHHHFVTYYARAGFYVVELAGSAIGRLYLLREAPYFLIVDIALLPDYRRRGLGGTLLAWIKALAYERGAAGIDLHVNQHNPDAQRLYAREGFVVTKPDGPYIGMRWTREALPQLNTA